MLSVILLIVVMLIVVAPTEIKSHYISFFIITAKFYSLDM